MRLRRQGRRGFTLLEVLIAVAILAIGLVAMMAMQVSFVQGTTMARDTTVALELGEMVVEQMRTEGAMWSNIAGPLDANRTPVLFTGTETSRNAYFNLFGGFPVNHEGLPRNPNAPLANGASVSENALMNAKFCIDTRMNFMDNTDREVIVGQVRVVWPSDNEAPWLGAPLNQPVACANGGQGLNNILYINGDMNLPNPRINVVHVPFAIKRHNL